MGPTTVSVIQPSFIPWRGYFQIIAASNVFILYDDVQYDKEGWRNRNRIKTHAGSQWITIPVLTKGRMGQTIRETEINPTIDWPRKILGSVRQAYAKAPYFDVYYPWLEKRFGRSYRFLCDLDDDLTRDICGFLRLETTIRRSSELGLKSEDRVERLVEICRMFDARRYLSGPSARAYLNEALPFQGARIEVVYQDYSSLGEYAQMHPPFDPQVSMLDFLMCCNTDNPFGQASAAQRAA